MVSQETVHDNRPVDNFLFKAMLMEQLSGEKYDQDESPYFRQASLSQEKLPVIEPNQELKNEMKSTEPKEIMRNHRNSNKTNDNSSSTSE